jgi:hypothetical protein
MQIHKGELMSPKIMLRLTMLSVLVSALLLLGILNTREVPKLESSVTIRNNSLENISGGYVIVCNTKYNIPGIDSGLTYTIRFHAQSESDYEVMFRFSDSRVLRQKLGYVTFDMRFSDSILVSPTGVSLQRPEPVPTGKIYRFSKR